MIKTFLTTIDAVEISVLSIYLYFETANIVTKICLHHWPGIMGRLYEALSVRAHFDNFWHFNLDNIYQFFSFQLQSYFLGMFKWSFWLISDTQTTVTRFAEISPLKRILIVFGNFFRVLCEVLNLNFEKNYAIGHILIDIIGQRLNQLISYLVTLQSKLLIWTTTDQLCWANSAWIHFFLPLQNSF